MDLGVVFIDTRRIDFLEPRPQFFRFSRMGQSQSGKVVAVLNDGTAYNVSAARFGTTYSVDRPEVASVDADGVITAVGQGLATVRASHRGKEVGFFVSVEPFSSALELTSDPPALSFRHIGQTAQLSIRAGYSDGATADATMLNNTSYRALHPAVAFVDSSGRVTASGAGSTTIVVTRASALELPISVDVPVVVNIPSENELIFLDASPRQALLRRIGSTVQLLVEGVQRNGSRIDLTAPSAGTLYESTASSVAIVDRAGLVTAVADGVARITAANPGSSVSVDVQVSLSSLLRLDITPAGISVPINSISPAVTRQLTVTGRFSDGSLESLTSSSMGTGFQSSNAGVGAIGPSGMVTFSQPGEVTITATNSGLSAQAHFTVTRMTPAPLSLLRGTFNNLAAQGSTAYLTSSAGLSVVTATSPVAPAISATIPGSAMVDVAVSGSRAYVAETSALAVVNVSNPAAPFRVASLSGSSVRGVAVDGGRVYFTDGARLRVHDADTFAAVGEVSGLPGTPNAVAVSGGLAFVALGSAGVAVIDVSTPSAPILAKVVPTAFAVEDIASRSRAAFFPGSTAAGRGVLTLDASDPPNARITGQTTLPMNANGVGVAGDLLFAAENLFVNSLPIFNVSRPESPAYLGTLDFPGDAEGLRVAAARPFVYLLNGSGPDAGLAIGLYDQETIPPSASLISPLAGSSAVEGSALQVRAAASDNIGVARVTYFVDGVAQSSSATAPDFPAAVRLPLGSVGRSVRIGAQAQDLGGLLSAVSEVLVNSVPDPLTTVSGRLVTVFGDPVPNAPVTVADRLQTTSGPDGTFIVSKVPTFLGSVVVTATSVVSGLTLAGRTSRPPVLGGVTRFGDVVCDAGVSLSGVVSGTLDARRGPFRVTGNVTVPAGQTLTLPPGTVLKFSPGLGMSVQGALVSSGTAARPVVLTSLADDSIGGDTGGDGPTRGVPGQWAALAFQNSTPATRLFGTTIRFGQAVELQAAAPVLDGVTIASMSAAALRMDPNSAPGGQGNRAVGSPLNAIEVSGGTINRVVVWAAIGLPYVVRSGEVKVSGVGSLLRVAAGGVVKLFGGPAATRLAAASGGRIEVPGTAEAPVVFTSLRDDSAGGDTNNDGAASAPAPGDWSDILLQDAGAVHSVSHADLRYGRGSGGGMLWVLGSTAVVSDVQLSSAEGRALVVDSGFLDLRRSVLAGNSGAALDLAGANPRATVAGTRFAGNGGAAAVNLVLGRLDMSDVSFLGNQGAAVAADHPAGVLAIASAAFSGLPAGTALLRVHPNADFTLTGPITADGSGLRGVDVGAGQVTRVQTWRPSPVPYLVRSGEVKVSGAGSVLRVAAGGVVKLFGGPAATRLVAASGGRIEVPGTAEAPVVFTSLRDDSAGGDANNDGATTVPAPGDWSDILLQDAGAVHSISHADLRYGRGSGGGMLWVLGSTAVVSDVQLSSAEGRALVVDSGFLDLRRSVLAGNSGAALDLAGANPRATVAGTRFAGNGGAAAVNLVLGRLDMSDVSFLGNQGVAVAADHPAGALSIASAAFSGLPAGTALLRVHPNADFALTGPITADGSGLRAVDVGGGQVTRAQTWRPSPVPYLVRSGEVKVSGAGSVLRVAAGTVVKLLGGASATRLVAASGGRIEVPGTAEAPVVFTSLRDDSAGGDTNNDGAASAPAPGDWSDILLQDAGAVHSLSHADLRYGRGISGGMLWVVGSTVVVSDARLSSVDGRALVVDNGFLGLSGGSVRNSAIGIQANSSRASVNFCAITGNTSFGILNNTPAFATVNAENNWWGSATGPTHALNPGGTGDAASNGVDFSPFLTAAP